LLHNLIKFYMLSIFEYNVLISISVNISTSKTTKAI